MPVSIGNFIVTKELRTQYQNTFRRTHNEKAKNYARNYYIKYRAWNKVKEEFRNILLEQ